MLVREEELSSLPVDAQRKFPIAAPDDDNVMILIFDPEIALGGSLPTLEPQEIGPALGEVAQAAFGGIRFGVARKVVGTDAPDGNDILPMGMGEVMNKADLFLSAKLANVIAAEGTPLVIVEVDGTLPLPARLRTAGVLLRNLSILQGKRIAKKRTLEKRAITRSRRLYDHCPATPRSRL
ncbi:MAG: hypothetical protein WC076_09870 [Terrimicrobiaceae bacterium]